LIIYKSSRILAGHMVW